MKDNEEEYTLGQALSEAPEEDLRDLMAQVPQTLSEAFRRAIDERYEGLVLTKPEKKRVQGFMKGLRLGGSAGLPLICTGDYCDFRNACPLYEMKVGPPKDTGKVDKGGNPIFFQVRKAPVGQPCPLEQSAVMHMRLMLSGYLRDEEMLAHPVIKTHINELCQIAALEWRCNMKLAYDFHGVTQEVPAAVSPQGEVYTRKEVSPVAELLERLSARRSRLLKELVMTPEAEYKKMAALKQTKDDSLSRRNAEVMAKLQAAEAPAVKELPEHVKTGVLKDAPDDEETDGEAA
jgi:hypothetical protein